MDLANRILALRSFGNQRVNMYWCSSAESEKLVKSIEDTVEKLTQAGPNPLKSSERIEIKEKKVLTTPAE